MIRRLRFRSLNHAPGDAIDPLRPVEADSNALIFTSALGAQPTRKDLLLVLSGRQ